MVELTEDALVAAFSEHRDVQGIPIRPRKVVCGSRAALRAKRILSEPIEPFMGVPMGRVVGDRLAEGVEVDPQMSPDDWRLE